MKKYFIVADVHSFYDEMMTALNEKGWDSNNPDHIFVSLGDMFDRGPQSCEVMDFLMSIPEDRRIFILGNHELLMEEMIARGGILYHDITNGTVRTATDLADTRDPDATIQQWKDATWINGMEAWDNGVKEYGKTIWCGHWHTSWGHAKLHHYGVEWPEDGGKAHFSPFKDEGIVAMDACTAYSHKVNCEVIEMED